MSEVRFASKTTQIGVFKTTEYERVGPLLPLSVVSLKFTKKGRKQC